MQLETGGRHLIVRTYDEGDIILQDLDTGECRKTTDAQLYDAIFGNLVRVRGHSLAEKALDGQTADQLRARGVSAKALEQGSSKLLWVQAMRRHGVTRFVDEPWVRALVERLAATELQGMPRWEIRTLYETDLTMRKSEGDIAEVIPKFALRGGAGKFRIHPVTHQFILEEIKEGRPVRLRGQPTRVATRPPSLLVRVNDRVKEYNRLNPQDPATPASESTVRRIHKVVVPRYDLLVAKSGKEYADNVFRTHSTSRDTAERPLEVSEYDDVDTGVFCVDERNGLPWGRAFVTNGLDQCTDLVLGFDFGDTHRSYESAISALCHSLVPKPFAPNSAMGYGVQGAAILDNATYNTGKALEYQSGAANLLLAFARSRGPTEKSGIEHFNWRVQDDFCRTLPGWVGNRDRDALKNGIVTATMTIQELERMYREWVCGRHANTPGQDGLTPKQRWLRFYSKHGPAIRYTPQEIALFRLRPEPLTFRDSGGVKRLTVLRYDCDALAQLRKQLGHNAKVMTFVDRYDLTYLLALNPLSQTMIRVPCTEDERYVRGLTERQHKHALAIQFERKNRNPSIAELAQSLRTLQQMVVECEASNKLRKRAWARRVRAGSTDSLPIAPAVAEEPREQVITELEYQILQLQEIDLTEDESW
jgi:hypothetical protein